MRRSLPTGNSPPTTGSDVVGAAKADVARGGLGGAEGVLAPFPHVPDGVVEAEAVGLERGRRRGGEVAVLERVVPGEVALPDVAAPAGTGGELVTPGVAGAVESASGGVLPLG